jgi:hypothetical protein
VKFECPQKFIVIFSIPFKEEAIALTDPMFKKNYQAGILFNF